MSIKKRDIGSWVFTVAVLAVAVFVLFRPAAPAATPALFAGGAATLDGAIARAEGSGRVVFAYATADWCGPCQSYKKGALSDPRVEAWVRANAEPVYIDVDDAREDAQRLNVNGIPATFVIRDGRVVDRIEGVTGAGALLAWLDRVAAAD